MNAENSAVEYPEMKLQNGIWMRWKRLEFIVNFDRVKQASVAAIAIKEEL